MIPLYNKRDNENDVLILGGGLSGLTAAEVLNRANQRIVVVEGDEKVGGLARTIEYKGFRFDLGGHRFATNNQKLHRYVTELLDDDCLCVPRSSKILLHGRYFDYPLRPLNAICGFGLSMSASIMFDYLSQRIRARLIKSAPVSLQDWVIDNFGQTMFDIYFRDYSEKVWGVECKRIDMSWMEQRIQGLSLAKAIKQSLLPWHGQKFTTLTDRFLYPRFGIGQIADKLAESISQDNAVQTGTRVLKVCHSDFRVKSIEVEQAGQRYTLNGKAFISTIPLPVLIRTMQPVPPAHVLSAASQLGNRDLLTVTLMLDRPKITEHTWIYLPEKTIPFGRIHEPSNWSHDLAPEGQTHLVVEYFCNRGDSIWNSSDESLTVDTIEKLVALRLIKSHDVFDSVITRIINAYPLFEVGYKKHCRTIYDYLEKFTNLYTAGRNGMFRYYNMDHAMLAGMDAANEIIRSSRMTVENNMQTSTEVVNQ